ncbi:MAG: Asp-tRNA(Asn)/Glu-tRNA(Gln) amidotransferase GatCAB subunit C, partial [Alphaproteobacteria bacterium]|nr:Asp-tRNA(Asn)/Glu-tRNA(Gln) amidotransferase GatCAB subunit C [Alphaproteobacteria bacterium]
WLGSADRGTRLHMISNQPVSKLHSQLDHGSVSRAAKIQDRETMTIHPNDAARLQITEHEVVKVVNDRGACLVAAVISDDVMPGVIVISTGAWFDPDYTVGDALADGPLLCKHGNPNMLAPDNGTSCLAQGPGAHSCLVEIMRLASPPPPVTAFDAPNFCARTK